MIALGLVLFAAASFFLVWRYRRSRRIGAFGGAGVTGLLVILVAAVLLALEVWPVTIFVTPIIWTGYILAVDAAVCSIRGESLLRSQRPAFVWMAVLSVGLWLVFEAYNLRLQNWDYRGLPENRVVRTAGFVWSFATIWPAILETAEFLLA